MTALFEALHLRKRYGETTVVDDVSFAIAPRRMPGRHRPQRGEDHHHPHVPGPGVAERWRSALHASRTHRC